jgi:hypothetical protein
MSAKKKDVSAQKKEIAELSKDGEVKYSIIMFGRGFVVITKPEEIQHVEKWGHNWVIIPRYTTLRYWGTEHGIGQLVHHGPTDSTTCDAGLWPINVPVDAIHQTLDVIRPESVEAWEKMIGKTEDTLLAAGK